jgi:hypothetical protein
VISFGVGAAESLLGGSILFDCLTSPAMSQQAHQPAETPAFPGSGKKAHRHCQPLVPRRFAVMMRPMSNPTFKRLNEAWNAEPNAPCEEVAVSGSTVRLAFFLNRWAYEAQENERGCLTFEQCSMWRLGSTNDEGWYAGECHYSKVARLGASFVSCLARRTNDSSLPIGTSSRRSHLRSRHFLFYLRHNSFECFAAAWRFERQPSVNFKGWTLGVLRVSFLAEVGTSDFGLCVLDEVGYDVPSARTITSSADR